MILIRLFVQTVIFAIAQMWSNKIRSLLTCLGIIIGVLATTSIIALMNGIETYVVTQVESFGTQKIFVNGHRPDSMRRKVDWRDCKMSERDAQMLRDHCEALERVALSARIRGSVRSGDVTKADVAIVGIQPDWHEVEQRFVTTGRTLSSTDDLEAADVCLVNTDAIDELKLAGDGVGAHIFVNDRRFTVVGVVETRDVGPMFGMDDARSEVFLPYSTADKISHRWTWPDVTGLKKRDISASDAKEEIRFVLRNARGLEAEDDDTFRIDSVEQNLEVLNNITAGLTVGLVFIAGFSLVVGGVGIMNIMLVSVSERTREIGLRKAVGANPIVILLQFLIEAVILCFGGGLIGVILGQGIALLPRLVADAAPEVGEALAPVLDAETPMWAIMLAFGVSGTIGLVFGMLPAIKAARLDPIDALRHD